MRRLTLIVSLAVLMALAVAAAASAANITANVTFGYRMAIAEFPTSDERYVLQSEWRYYSNIYLRGSSGNVTAYLRMRPRSSDSWQPMQSTGSLASGFSDHLEGYLDIKGEFIPGLPGGTMRIGRFATNQNSWIANFGRRDGILLSDVKVGPATLALYQSFHNSNNRATMVKATGNLDIVDLTAVYVKQSRINDKKYSSTDFLIGADVSPIKDLKVGVEFASNGLPSTSNEDARLAWKINGELNSIPNLKLRASTWSTDRDFFADFRHNTNREKLNMNREWYGRPTGYGDPWMETGVSVGVTTTQAGLPFDVNFKTGTIFGDGLNAEYVSSGDLIVHIPSEFREESMTVVSVGTTIAEIKTDVAVTMISDNDPVIDVVATRRLPVSFLGGNVDLRGMLRLQDLDGDKDPRYAADATWAAPNGLTLGVHYANYDRKLDWNHNFSDSNLSEGFDIGATPDPGERAVDGFAITVGYQRTF